uniref:Uncharacterized protein n=1 Tax=Loa loa TaxID=7209 RepID=A0A1I7VY61_LOALO
MSRLLKCCRNAFGAMEISNGDGKGKQTTVTSSGGRRLQVVLGHERIDLCFQGKRQIQMERYLRVYFNTGHQRLPLT